MAIDRHGRDPGIAEIVRYFNLPEHCRWDLLVDSEVKMLHAEIARCLDLETGFPYSCRNYYWITRKNTSDILMRFKETQEMLWETIRFLRLRGRGVKVLVIKARQLYISSFCEAYLAWLTMTTPNNRGLLVSYDDEHAAYLFGMILHIYDQMPWWLRPMIGQRKVEEGLHLINPDPEMRGINPGMNSRLVVQGAKREVGVAEGQTVNSAHLSEFGSWDPNKARKIIMGDFRWALPDEPNTTAILETRVQKNSKFVERFWEKMVELGDDADWYPFFIPIYFDKSHFISPRPGWRPQEPEMLVKQRAAEEWCACPQCGQIRPAKFGGADMAGMACRDCGTVPYMPYTLQDGQMRWLELTRMNAVGETALVEMQQSLATNPQEAFASVTDTIFSKPAREWVSATTRQCLAKGYLASDGAFHAPRRGHGYQGEKGWITGPESAQCWVSGCKQDHSGENSRYLEVWQFPVRGARYACSVDPSHGRGGPCDYAVIIVAKISRAPEPDIQVACFRCNTIGAHHLADVANAIGRWYNDALMIVDYTNLQTTGDRLRIDLLYPNLYRRVIPDARQQQCNRYHWEWNNKNKESACQTLDAWLKDHSYIAKDPVFAKELRHFQRLGDGTLGSPDAKAEDGLGDDFEKLHDDTVTATMTLVVAAHQHEPRYIADSVTVVPQEDGVRNGGEWSGTCLKCEKRFPAQVPQERERCPYCGSIWMKWKMTAEKGPANGFSWEDMAGAPGVVRDRNGATEEFTFGYGGQQ